MMIKAVHFRYDTACFSLYLTELAALPAPNIRRLFKYLLSEPWENQPAIDKVEAFLPSQIDETKEGWKQASIAFQNGWRLVSDERSRAGRELRAQNNKLRKAVKRAKGTHQQWVRIYGYWNDAKQKLNLS